MLKDQFVAAAITVGETDAETIIALLKQGDIPAYRIGGVTDIYAASAARSLQEVMVPADRLDEAKAMITEAGIPLTPRHLDEGSGTPREKRIIAGVIAALVIAGVIFAIFSGM